MLQEATRRERTDMALLRRYRDTGDQASRELLVERMMPLVRSLVRKYTGRGEDADDLTQAGMVGLTKAIDRFDATSGHRFVSYAVPNITGEIRRHFRDHTWAVHVPRSLQELDAKVQATSRQVEAATGRAPTDEDLAGELGASVADVREARTAGRSYRALSMDAPTGEARNLADTHGREDPGYERVEQASLLRFARTALTDRERAVVDMRFGDELLQREIADEVGVSQMQVSRIISGAITKMSAHVASTPQAA